MDKSSDTEERRRSLGVGLTAEEREKITKVARRKGLSPGTYVRVRALEAAERDLKEMAT